MTDAVPDFTDAHEEAVDTLLHRRRGRPVPLELADGPALERGIDSTTSCPTRHRNGGGFNRREAQLILAEVVRGRGQAGADRLVADFRRDRVIGTTSLTVSGAPR